MATKKPVADAEEDLEPTLILLESLHNTMSDLASRANELTENLRKINKEECVRIVLALLALNKLVKDLSVLEEEALKVLEEKMGAKKSIH